MRFFPARCLNWAESTADGALPAEAHVVHLKGLWWRKLLEALAAEGSVRDYVTPTRRLEWNADALKLWLRYAK